jgi:serine/threonine protein kinase
MEKIIGHFPRQVIKEATGGHSESKYFSHGLVRVPSRLPRESLRKVQDQRTLREIVNEKDTVFLELVVGMLSLDPAERITAREALNHRFFTSVRKRIEVPTPQVQKAQPSKLQRASHERPPASRVSGSSSGQVFSGIGSHGKVTDQ